jgi:hypothetical protein
VSWDDLTAKRAAAPERDTEFERLHLAVFGSGAGADLLARDHAEIVDAARPAAAPEATLREHIGQRRLIRNLETLAARGRAAQSRTMEARD